MLSIASIVALQCILLTFAQVIQVKLPKSRKHAEGELHRSLTFNRHARKLTFFIKEVIQYQDTYLEKTVDGTFPAGGQYFSVQLNVSHLCPEDSSCALRDWSVRIYHQHLCFQSCLYNHSALLYDRFSLDSLRVPM